MGLIQSIMYGRGWVTRDATGREVSLYDHFNQGDGAEPPIDQATFNRVRNAANSLSPATWNGGPKWGLVVVAAWFIIGSAVRLAQGFSYFQLFGVVAWGFLLTLIVWGWQKLINASPGSFARQMLAHGHCASCGYQLPDTAGEGRTTCPECGAVWNNAGIRISPPPPP